MKGDTPADMLQNAINEGRMAEATGRLSENVTNWEIHKLNETGRLEDATFSLNNEPVNVELP